VHLAWRTLGLPRAESLAEADVVHSLDLLAPPTRRPLVVTVHDVVAVEHADLHPTRAVAVQRSRLAQLGRANVVLADSQSTADELVARGVDPGRVWVTHLGLTQLPPPVDPPLQSGPFVLAVGTLEPRKGHDILLRAFASPEFDGYRLVFAGPTAGRAQELTALAESLGVGGSLTILGKVDDAVLAGLYRDASALCMPSLAEGFGLPAVEAMSAGLPVVASDLAVVREVTGDGAALFETGSVDALRSALERVLNDQALAARLRREGTARAAHFTWDAAAQRTFEAYEQAFSEGPTRGD
jgi:glycosyltransferase involved in cell wall biosynthesis